MTSEKGTRLPLHPTLVSQARLVSSQDCSSVGNTVVVIDALSIHSD